jgi:Mg-chelatase subunit ChlD
MAVGDIEKRGESGGDIRASVGKKAIEIRRRGKPVEGTLAGRGSAYLVIDCSFSMGGVKLEQAKQGAVDFAREAGGKGYSVGLVKFDTRAAHICEPQHDLSALAGYVKRLKKGGSTNMAGGIEIATYKLRERGGPRAMVIVTDGQPNSTEAAIAAADKAKEIGIDIIAIGTDDADQDLLGRLTSREGLSSIVSGNELGRGIASSAKMLPGNDGKP